MAMAYSAVEAAVAVYRHRQGLFSQTYNKLEKIRKGALSSKCSKNPFILLALDCITYQGEIRGNNFSRRPR